MEPLEKSASAAAVDRIRFSPPTGERKCQDGEETKDGWRSHINNPIHTHTHTHMLIHKYANHYS